MPQGQPVINAHSWSTFLGGSRMRKRTLDAMAPAGTEYHDVFAMQAELGDHIAALTRNDGAYIANGAAAALAIAFLALMSDGDAAATAQLPMDRGGFRVLIQRSQRTPYDAVVRLVGASLVEIGDDNGTSVGQLVEAIERGARAYLFVPVRDDSASSLTLDEVVTVCKPRGIPVLVDAAAQLPPASNLWRYTTELGADAAAFSGGKEVRGPQNSGFLVGRRDLVEACRAIGPPHQTLARALKVSPEVMAGLVAAIEDYLLEDEDETIAQREKMVEMWVDSWDAIPGVEAFRDFPNVAGQPCPRAAVRIDFDRIPLSSEELANRLWHFERIAVASEGDLVLVNPSPVDVGEADIILDRLAYHLQNPAAHTGPTPQRPDL